MKRYLAIFGFVFIGVIAGLLVRGIPIVLQVQAGGGIPQTDRNGDVNGDARLDMSDAIYLLLHIFRDGPGPVALADSPELLERVARLEERIDEVVEPGQRAVLDHLSLVDLDDGQGGLAPTVRLSGANLQIVNGLGATNGYPENPMNNDPEVTGTNGVGNLIVGYMESRSADGVSDNRVGSHNLVVGAYNDYVSYGSIVGGLGNSVWGPYSAQVGGTFRRETNLGLGGRGCAPPPLGCIQERSAWGGMAFDLENDVIYSLDSSEQWSARVGGDVVEEGVTSRLEVSSRGPRHTRSYTRAFIDGDAVGLAYDSSRHRLYTVYDNHLWALDSETGELTEEIADLPREFLTRENIAQGLYIRMTYSPEADNVYLFEGRYSNRNNAAYLTSINVGTGQVGPTVAVRDSAGGNTFGIGGFYYDPRRNEILCGMIMSSGERRDLLFSLNPDDGVATEVGRFVGDSRVPNQLAYDSNSSTLYGVGSAYLLTVEMDADGSIVTQRVEF